MTHITFIGAGNMARSIIGGLMAEGAAASSITACDPKPEALQALTQDFGINTTTDNNAACASSDVIVLAVKPQVMGPVCETLRPNLPTNCLVISIAAGIDCRSLQLWLGDDIRLVRCMPNTPSLIRQGASGLYAKADVSNDHRALAEQILGAVGLVKWLPSEDLLDPVTAVSGSGPAYFFLFLEAMTDVGVELGLDRGTAKELAIQTAAGAAQLAQQSDVDLAELRRRVTSPGGTTERAIQAFEKLGLRAMVREAMQACAGRSQELARELGAKSD